MPRRAALIGSELTSLKGRSVTTSQAVEAIRESGLFDENFYVENYSYSDPLVKLVDPISHYLSIGAGKFFNPSPAFDTKRYLRQNPELAQTGENPLLHYCRVRSGCASQRVLRRKADEVRYPYPSKEPDFVNLSSRRKLHDRPRLNVIIPVYGGRKETLWAIYSVLSSANTTPFELIVVDDCSPDSTLSEDLVALSKRGLFTLYRNEKNLGFPRTVNRALARYPTRSAILLNSDTMVYSNWIDRLCAHATPGVATVTPFSNNAALCSYPVIFKENALPAGMTAGALDRLTARINHGQAVDVPTGVGFCMYISRSALDAVGPFGHRAFGKGYGEENDFCFRAAAAGYRNLHALDVFVYHKGRASFGTRASVLSERSRLVLAARHPEYAATLRRFALADPSFEARRKLDVAMIKRKRAKYRVLCLVGPDGTLNARLQRSRPGEALILGTPEYLGDAVRIKGLLGGVATPNLRMLDCVGKGNALKAFLERAGVSCVELHSPESYSREARLGIISTTRRLRITFRTFRPRVGTQFLSENTQVFDMK